MGLQLSILKYRKKTTNLKSFINPGVKITSQRNELSKSFGEKFLEFCTTKIEDPQEMKIRIRATGYRTQPDSISGLNNVLDHYNPLLKESGRAFYD